MLDLIRESANSGKLVIWEECARDGAQAKTLMNAQQRIDIVRAHAALYGQDAARHLIFATGFPAIAPEEVEIMRQVVAEVDTCYLASHGRMIKDDVDLGIDIMKKAKYGRVSYFFPASERMCQVLVHKPPREVLKQGIEMARYALDKANGIPIDVALIDVARADPNYVAEIILALSEEGIAVVKLCDSVGEFYPFQADKFFQTVMRQVGMAKMAYKPVVGAHLHNDLGFAFINNLEAVKNGVRIVASSWLGLGERNGLPNTEQVTFALTYQPERQMEKLGYTADFWYTPPNLRGIVPIAQKVSEYTGMLIRVTDAIVGTGVNSISTGTPFTDPNTFQPFDAEEVLGVSRRIVVTQLASARVVQAIAEELGYELTKEQANVAAGWVKKKAYERGEAVVPGPEFSSFLHGLLSSGTNGHNQVAVFAEH
jgi:2-isopropylmalate synthase